METFSTSLVRKSTGHRGIPLTKSSDAELWCFLSKQSRRRWFETPSRISWRHCNVGSVHYQIPLLTVIMKPRLWLAEHSLSLLQETDRKRAQVIRSDVIEYDERDLDFGVIEYDTPQALGLSILQSYQWLWWYINVDPSRWSPVCTGTGHSHHFVCRCTNI